MCNHTQRIERLISNTKLVWCKQCGAFKLQEFNGHDAFTDITEWESPQYHYYLKKKEEKKTPKHKKLPKITKEVCPECRRTFILEIEKHDFDAIGEFGKCTDCLWKCPYCKAASCHKRKKR